MNLSNIGKMNLGKLSETPMHPQYYIPSVNAEGYVADNSYSAVVFWMNSAEGSLQTGSLSHPQLTKICSSSWRDFAPGFWT